MRGKDHFQNAEVGIWKSHPGLSSYQKAWKKTHVAQQRKRQTEATAAQEEVLTSERKGDKMPRDFWTKSFKRSNEGHVKECPIKRVKLSFPVDITWKIFLKKNLWAVFLQLWFEWPQKKNSVHVDKKSWKWQRPIFREKNE